MKRASVTPLTCAGTALRGRMAGKMNFPSRSMGILKQIA
jgi:hypothetical protein